MSSINQSITCGKSGQRTDGDATADFDMVTETFVILTLYDKLAWYTIDGYQTGYLFINVAHVLRLGDRFGPESRTTLSVVRTCLYRDDSDRFYLYICCRF